MHIKSRLIILFFLEFFIFGSWLVTFGAYAIKKLHFTGTEVGLVYSTMGIASAFAPVIVGFIADRWINAERLFAICHILGAIVLFVITNVTNPQTMIWCMLLYSIAYMPTIPLANAICYRILIDNGYQTIKTFPSIRVFGTISFILALWVTSLLGLELSPHQLTIAGIASLLLAAYSLTLPPCIINDKKQFSLFKDIIHIIKEPQISTFFIFAILIGALLQVNNTFVSSYLHDFDLNPLYKDSFIVNHSAVIISISQISEVLFMLVIPFFLTKYGIKKVVLISLTGWFIRFAFLAYANPEDRFWMIIVSMIISGCAFDFFNISASLFIENSVASKVRASAQGLLYVMHLGLGGILGSYLGGRIVDWYSILVNSNLVRNWQNIWLFFVVYSIIVGISFFVFFRYQYNSTKKV